MQIILKIKILTLSIIIACETWLKITELIRQFISFNLMLCNTYFCCGCKASASQMLCTVPALHSRLLVAQSKTNHMNKSKYKYKTNLTFDKLIPTSMDINDYKKISLITNDISVKEVISDENNTTLY